MACVRTWEVESGVSPESKTCRIQDPQHTGSRIHETAGWLGGVRVCVPGKYSPGSDPGLAWTKAVVLPASSSPPPARPGGGGGAAKKAMHEWASKSAIVVRGMISCGMVWWSGTLVVRDCEVWCAV